jgi:hypothetical protein
MSIEEKYDYIFNIKNDMTIEEKYEYMFRSTDFNKLEYSIQKNMVKKYFPIGMKVRHIRNSDGAECYAFPFVVKDHTTINSGPFSDDEDDKIFIIRTNEVNDRDQFHPVDLYPDPNWIRNEKLKELGL